MRKWFNKQNYLSKLISATNADILTIFFKKHDQKVPSSKSVSDKLPPKTKQWKFLMKYLIKKKGFYDFWAPILKFLRAIARQI